MMLEVSACVARLARITLSGAAFALAFASGAVAGNTQPAASYASLASLPDWSGWWTLPNAPPSEYAKEPAPLRPEDAARMRTARKLDDDPDPKRWCHPYEFTGFSGGFVDAVEFLFTPGRVTLTNEGGLIRRIYTDGRPLPTDVEPTNTGTSVGHWEGQTLVVETIGISPNAEFPQRAPGAPRVGKGVKITERITLKDPDTLVFDITTVAPELFTQTDHRQRVYSRSQKKSAREVSFCVDHDRSIDPVSGKQRFDMTPPADLPPPPPPK